MKARVPEFSNDIVSLVSSKIEKSEQIMNDTWIEFRNALANPDNNYADIQKALELKFLDRFDEMFRNVGKQKLPISLFQCLENVCVGRGAILKENEELVYSRFIPDKTKSKRGNRFSPQDKEWLYLAIGEVDSLAIKCAEKECKAENGNRFGFCHFELMPQHRDLEIIDLTIADNMSYDEINNILYKEYGRRYKRKKKNLIKLGYWMAQLIDNEDEKISQCEIERWFLLNYCKMMSKNIFKPVEDCSAELEYKPFQTLAKYFEEQGYVGIKYKSTVFDEANNIVIFDKSFAKPCGEILDYYVSD